MNIIEEFKEKEKKVVEFTSSAWKKQMIVDKYDRIKPNSIQNIRLILENDENLKGKIAYDEFAHEIVLTESITLRNVTLERVNDVFESVILEYIETKYRVLFSSGNFEQAVTNVAHQRKFNPVKNYFETCYQKWDKQERIPALLSTYLGADSNDLTTLMLKTWLCGAVLKTYQPYSKFDYVLDLVGGQGVGKTTFLQKLGKDWYTDNITNFSDKDNFTVMLRHLIVNDDEMVATKASSFDALKKFATAQTLEYRVPYGKKTDKKNKNFVIARTTNEETYLKDKTGERRFLPIFADLSKQERHPVTDLCPEEVDQIWGEAVTLYKNGFDFSALDKRRDELNELRENFIFVDVIEETLERYLDIDIPVDFYKATVKGENGRHARKMYIQNMLDDGKSNYFENSSRKPREFVTNNQILWEAFGEEVGKGGNKLGNKVKYIMDNRKGWTRVKREGKRGWKRI